MNKNSAQFCVPVPDWRGDKAFAAHAALHFEQLRHALTVLLNECGKVAPLAGRDSSVRAVRDASKFIGAMTQAKMVLEDCKKK